MYNVYISLSNGNVIEHANVNHEELEMIRYQYSRRRDAVSIDTEDLSSQDRDIEFAAA